MREHSPLAALQRIQDALGGDWNVVHAPPGVVWVGGPDGSAAGVITFDPDKPYLCLLWDATGTKPLGRGSLSPTDAARLLAQHVSQEGR